MKERAIVLLLLATALAVARAASAPLPGCSNFRPAAARALDDGPVSCRGGAYQCTARAIAYYEDARRGLRPLRPRGQKGATIASAALCAMPAETANSIAEGTSRPSIVVLEGSAGAGVCAPAGQPDACFYRAHYPFRGGPDATVEGYEVAARPVVSEPYPPTVHYLDTNYAPPPKDALAASFRWERGCARAQDRVFRFAGGRAIVTDLHAETLRKFERGEAAIAFDPETNVRIDAIWDAREGEADHIDVYTPEGVNFNTGGQNFPRLSDDLNACEETFDRYRIQRVNVTYVSRNARIVYELDGVAAPDGGARLSGIGPLAPAGKLVSPYAAVRAARYNKLGAAFVPRGDTGEDRLNVHTVGLADLVAMRRGLRFTVETATPANFGTLCGEACTMLERCVMAVPKTTWRPLFDVTLGKHKWECHLFSPAPTRAGPIKIRIAGFDASAAKANATHTLLAEHLGYSIASTSHLAFRDAPAAPTGATLAGRHAMFRIEADRKLAMAGNYTYKERPRKGIQYVKGGADRVKVLAEDYKLRAGAEDYEMDFLYEDANGTVRAGNPIAGWNARIVEQDTDFVYMDLGFRWRQAGYNWFEVRETLNRAAEGEKEPGNDFVFRSMSVPVRFDAYPLQPIGKDGAKAYAQSSTSYLAYGNPAENRRRKTLQAGDFAWDCAATMRRPGCSGALAFGNEEVYYKPYYVSGLSPAIGTEGGSADDPRIEIVGDGTAALPDGAFLQATFSSAEQDSLKAGDHIVPLYGMSPKVFKHFLAVRGFDYSPTDFTRAHTSSWGDAELCEKMTGERFPPMYAPGGSTDDLDARFRTKLNALHARFSEPKSFSDTPCVRRIVDESHFKLRFRRYTEACLEDKDCKTADQQHGGWLSYRGSPITLRRVVLEEDPYPNQKESSCDYGHCSNDIVFPVKRKDRLHGTFSVAETASVADLGLTEGNLMIAVRNPWCCGWKDDQDWDRKAVGVDPPAAYLKKWKHFQTFRANRKAGTLGGNLKLPADFVESVPVVATMDECEMICRLALGVFCEAAHLVKRDGEYYYCYAFRHGRLPLSKSVNGTNGNNYHLPVEPLSTSKHATRIVQGSPVAIATESDSNRFKIVAGIPRLNAFVGALALADEPAELAASSYSAPGDGVLSPHARWRPDGSRKTGYSIEFSPTAGGRAIAILSTRAAIPNQFGAETGGTAFASECKVRCEMVDECVAYAEHEGAVFWPLSPEFRDAMDRTGGFFAHMTAPYPSGVSISCVIVLAEGGPRGPHASRALEPGWLGGYLQPVAYGHALTLRVERDALAVSAFAPEPTSASNADAPVPQPLTWHKHTATGVSWACRWDARAVAPRASGGPACVGGGNALANVARGLAPALSNDTLGPFSVQCSDVRAFPSFDLSDPGAWAANFLSSADVPCSARDGASPTAAVLALRVAESAREEGALSLTWGRCRNLCGAASPRCIGAAWRFEGSKPDCRLIFSPNPVVAEWPAGFYGESDVEDRIRKASENVKDAFKGIAQHLTLPEPIRQIRAADGFMIVAKAGATFDCRWEAPEGKAYWPCADGGACGPELGMCSPAFPDNLRRFNGRCVAEGGKVMFWRIPRGTPNATDVDVRCKSFGGAGSSLGGGSFVGPDLAGADIYGDNYRRSAAATEAKCAALCAEDGDCAGYMYDTWTNMRWCYRIKYNSTTGPKAYDPRELAVSAVQQDAATGEGCPEFRPEGLTNSYVGEAVTRWKDADPEVFVAGSETVIEWTPRTRLCEAERDGDAGKLRWSCPRPWECAVDEPGGGCAHPTERPMSSARKACYGTISVVFGCFEGRKEVRPWKKTDAEEVVHVWDEYATPRPRYRCIRKAKRFSRVHPVRPRPFSEVFPGRTPPTKDDRMPTTPEKCALYCTITPGCVASTHVADARVQGPTAEPAGTCLYSRNMTWADAPIVDAVGADWDEPGRYLVRSFWPIRMGGIEAQDRYLANLTRYDRRSRAVEARRANELRGPRLFGERWGGGAGAELRAWWACPSAGKRLVDTVSGDANRVQDGNGAPTDRIKSVSYSDPGEAVVLRPGDGEVVARLLDCRRSADGPTESTLEEYAICPTGSSFARTACTELADRAQTATCAAYRGTVAYRNLLMTDFAGYKIEAVLKQKLVNANENASLAGDVRDEEGCRARCGGIKACFGYRFRNNACYLAYVPMLTLDVEAGYDDARYDWILPGAAPFVPNWNWKVSLEEDSSYTYPPISPRAYVKERLKARVPKVADLYVPCDRSSMALMQSLSCSSSGNAFTAEEIDAIVSDAEFRKGETASCCHTVCMGGGHMGLCDAYTSTLENAVVYVSGTNASWDARQLADQGLVRYGSGNSTRVGKIPYGCYFFESLGEVASVGTYAGGDFFSASRWGVYVNFDFPSRDWNLYSPIQPRDSNAQILSSGYEQENVKCDLTKLPVARVSTRETERDAARDVDEWACPHGYKCGLAVTHTCVNERWKDPPAVRGTTVSVAYRTSDQSREFGACNMDPTRIASALNPRADVLPMWYRDSKANASDEPDRFQCISTGDSYTGVYDRVHYGADYRLARKTYRSTGADAVVSEGDLTRNMIKEIPDGHKSRPLQIVALPRNPYVAGRAACVAEWDPLSPSQAYDKVTGAPYVRKRARAMRYWFCDSEAQCLNRDRIELAPGCRDRSPAAGPLPVYDLVPAAAYVPPAAYNALTDSPECVAGSAAQDAFAVSPAAHCYRWSLGENDRVGTGTDWPVRVEDLVVKEEFWPHPLGYKRLASPPALETSFPNSLMTLVENVDNAWSCIARALAQGESHQFVALGGSWCAFGKEPPKGLIPSVTAYELDAAFANAEPDISRPCSVYVEGDLVDPARNASGTRKVPYPCRMRSENPRATTEAARYVHYALVVRVCGRAGVPCNGRCVASSAEANRSYCCPSGEPWARPKSDGGWTCASACAIHQCRNQTAYAMRCSEGAACGCKGATPTYCGDRCAPNCCGSAEPLALSYDCSLPAPLPAPNEPPGYLLPPSAWRCVEPVGLRYARGSWTNARTWRVCSDLPLLGWLDPKVAPTAGTSLKIRPTRFRAHHEMDCAFRARHMGYDAALFAPDALPIAWANATGSFDDEELKSWTAATAPANETVGWCVVGRGFVSNHALLTGPDWAVGRVPALPGMEAFRADRALGTLVDVNLPQAARAAGTTAVRLPVFATCPAGRRTCAVDPGAANPRDAGYECHGGPYSHLGCCPGESFDTSYGTEGCVRTCGAGRIVRRHKEGGGEHDLCLLPVESGCRNLTREWKLGVQWNDGVLALDGVCIDDVYRCAHPHEAHHSDDRDGLAPTRTRTAEELERPSQPLRCYRIANLDRSRVWYAPDPKVSLTYELISAKHADCNDLAARAANDTTGRLGAFAWDRQERVCRMVPEGCALFGDDPAVSELWEPHSAACVPRAACLPPARPALRPGNGSLVEWCIEANRYACPGGDPALSGPPAAGLPWDAGTAWNETRRCCARASERGYACCDDPIAGGGDGGFLAPGLYRREAAFRGGCSAECSPPWWVRMRPGNGTVPYCKLRTQILCESVGRRWVAERACCLNDLGGCAEDPERDFFPHRRDDPATEYDPLEDTATDCPPGQSRVSSEETDVGYRCGSWWASQCASDGRWTGFCCRDAADPTRCANEVGTRGRALGAGAAAAACPEGRRACGAGECAAPGECCSWEGRAPGTNATGCTILGLATTERASRRARTVRGRVHAGSTRVCAAPGGDVLPWRCPARGTWRCGEALRATCHDGANLWRSSTEDGVTFLCDMDHAPAYDPAAEDAGLVYLCRAAEGALPEALCRAGTGVGCRTCPAGTNYVPMDGGYACTAIRAVGGLRVPIAWRTVGPSTFAVAQWRVAGESAVAAGCAFRWGEHADALACFRAAHAAGAQYAFWQRASIVGAVGGCGLCPRDPSSTGLSVGAESDVLSFDPALYSDLPEKTGCPPDVIPPYSTEHNADQHRARLVLPQYGTCSFRANVVFGVSRGVVRSDRQSYYFSTVVATCPAGYRNCNGTCAGASASGCCPGEVARPDGACDAACGAGETELPVEAEYFSPGRRCASAEETACPAGRWSRADRCCRNEVGCCPGRVLVRTSSGESCQAACGSSSLPLPPARTVCAPVDWVRCVERNRTWNATERSAADRCLDLNGCRPFSDAWYHDGARCVARAGKPPAQGYEVHLNPGGADGHRWILPAHKACEVAGLRWNSTLRGCERRGDGCVQGWYSWAGRCTPRCPNGTVPRFDAAAAAYPCITNAQKACEDLGGHAFEAATGCCRSRATGCCHGSHRHCAATNSCVPATACCPGDRPTPCGNGLCVPSSRCCPDAHEPIPCDDGRCSPRGVPCPNRRICSDGTSVANATCCPDERLGELPFECVPRLRCFPRTERTCAEGSCVPIGECCPGEVRDPSRGGACASLPPGATACPGGGIALPGVSCCPGEALAANGTCGPADAWGCAPGQRFCDGACRDATKYGPQDACGVCGGTSTTCLGCDGLVGSGRRYDRCGLCRAGADDASGACDKGPCVAGFDACGGCLADPTRPPCRLAPGTAVVRLRIPRGANATRAVEAIAAAAGLGPSRASLVALRVDVVAPSIEYRRRLASAGAALGGALEPVRGWEPPGRPPADGWVFSGEAIAYVRVAPVPGSNDARDAADRLEAVAPEGTIEGAHHEAPRDPGVPVLLPVDAPGSPNAFPRSAIGTIAGAAAGIAVALAAAWAARRAAAR